MYAICCIVGEIDISPVVVASMSEKSQSSTFLRIAVSVVAIVLFYFSPSTASSQEQRYICTPETIVGLAPVANENRWKGATFGRIGEIELLGVFSGKSTELASDYDWELFRGNPPKKPLGTICIGSDGVIPTQNGSVFCQIIHQYTFDLSLESLRFQLYLNGGYISDDIEMGNPLIAAGRCELQPR